MMYHIWSNDWTIIPYNFYYCRYTYNGIFATRTIIPYNFYYCRYWTSPDQALWTIIPYNFYYRKLPVQNIYAQVEISCKGYPQKVQDEQKSCGHGYSVKRRYIKKNCHPQTNEPYKRKQIRHHTKEEYRPEEVECELQGIHTHSVIYVRSWDSWREHKIRGKTHWQIEQRPHNDKHYGRGRKRRLSDTIKARHTSARQICRECSYTQRNKQTNYKEPWFYLFIQSYHLGVCILNTKV